MIHLLALVNYVYPSGLFAAPHSNGLNGEDKNVQFLDWLLQPS